MEFTANWKDAAETKLELTVNGPLRYGQFQALQSYIFKLKEKPPVEITFNLMDVEHIDSSGLGLLIIADEITGKQHKVTLTNPNDTVAHLLEVCKIDKMMDIRRG